MAITFSNASRTARANATNTDIGASAQIKLYTGTVPTDANAALSGNTLLGTLTGSATFGTVSNGVLTANAITQDSSADATGTATFGRVLKSDGTTVVLQFSVGTSGADLNLNSVSITAGGPIGITSFVLTEG